MKRDKWSSNFGFIMAAAGSAVGLGNLWKFPYLVGSHGGAMFIIIYLILLILIGTPILLSEMSIGRSTNLNAISACKKINPKWAFVGAIGVACTFIILSYYSIIGGWVLKYLFTYIIGQNIENPNEFFVNFSASSAEPIVWHLIFTAITVLIVIGGISKGIERVSKIFLPILLLFIVILTINSLTLPNASKGIEFFIIPNLSEMNSIRDFIKIVLSAMGQVFFSLSLGMGTLITYGSYLDKSSNLKRNALAIPIIDFIIAILAGKTILPAVFSFGIEPTAGPGLIFQALPNVFSKMPYGRLMAIIFFTLVLFAAITSAISLLEVVAAYFIDKFHWKRSSASIIPAVFTGTIGCIASLSFGLLSGMKFIGMNFFDFLTFLSDKILMPIGGFFMCIFVGYIWKTKNMLAEVGNIKPVSTGYAKFINISIKYIAPSIILIILISSFF